MKELIIVSINIDDEDETLCHPRCDHMKSLCQFDMTCLVFREGLQWSHHGKIDGAVCGRYKRREQCIASSKDEED